ncbi:MAG TPA: hypothetical protein VFU92_09340 [Usitatibacter sp.]|nr:hypothetical protein [Usitatibacter sp.]
MEVPCANENFTGSSGLTTVIERLPVPPVLPALGEMVSTHVPPDPPASTMTPFAVESPSAKLIGEGVVTEHAEVEVPATDTATSTAPVLPPVLEILTVVPVVVLFRARLAGPEMVNVPGPAVAPQATTTPPLGDTVMLEYEQLAVTVVPERSSTV